MRGRPRGHRRGERGGRALSHAHVDTVTSAGNPRIKAARRLHRADARAESGLVLLEGRRLVAAALDAAVPLDALFVTDSTETLALAPGVRATLVAPDLLASVATTAHPQGIVAVAAWTPLDALPATARRVLVLAGVADPGNSGTLVRSAAAAGWDAVVVAGGCDPTNPKALRASAGATFRVPVVRARDAADVLAGLAAAGFTVVGAATRGGVGPGDVPRGGRLALVVGGEAHGLPPVAALACDTLVTVPLHRDVESLNAAAAGAVLLFALGAPS